MCSGWNILSTMPVKSTTGCGGDPQSQQRCCSNRHLWKQRTTSWGKETRQVGSGAIAKGTQTVEQKTRSDGSPFGFQSRFLSKGASHLLIRQKALPTGNIYTSTDKQSAWEIPSASTIIQYLDGRARRLGRRFLLRVLPRLLFELVPHEPDSGVVISHKLTR